MLHPALVAAAAKAARTPLREGRLRSDGGGRTYTGSVDGVSLELRAVKSDGRWIVGGARHFGSEPGPMRGVVDMFCQVVEGLPLQEAADHGAIHAMERLLGDPLARPVAGILTTHSAGLAFVRCETLIRGIARQHKNATGEDDGRNFWNPPLSRAWLSNTSEGRRQMLQPVLKRFRQAHGLNERDFWIAAIEKTRRIVIGFGSKVGYEEKPGLLMRFEVDIRRATGDRLELFMEEAKDSNQIRRLGPDEEGE